MQKNKWNSRDDRSGKPGKPAKRTVDSSSRPARPKTERPADSNKASGKRFGDQSPKGYRADKRSDEKPSFGRSGKKVLREVSGDKPAFRKSFRGDDDRRGGDRQYVRRSEDAGKPVMRKRGGGGKGPSKPAVNPQNDGLIRLNRYISNAGICSRRKADELIEAGVIAVNGQVVSELGYKVDPSKDVVRYNGELLKREKMVYVLLNKPKDYITTTDDPQERHTVMHLIANATSERIYPVGRLDRNTTGLLLFTNDGELTDKLSHPRNSVTKIYHVELNKNLSQGDFNKISFGLELEDGPIKPDEIRYVQGGSKREVGIQIHSGKNRIVRRIFEHLGYEVVKLDRVIYANLTKKDLPRGRWRHLEEKEIIQLKHLV